jgi:hypothetical protein
VDRKPENYWPPPLRRREKYSTPCAAAIATGFIAARLFPVAGWIRLPHRFRTLLIRREGKTFEENKKPGQL